LGRHGGVGRRHIFHGLRRGAVGRRLDDRPSIRGTITGMMTTLGGVGHTLPYLVGDFLTATALAIAIVLMELWAIAWMRARYIDTRFLQAASEVVGRGLIVLGAGVLIGNA
jgi:VIT1/CCC1 family predicted Fe2+/Mn2+ transporter